MNSQLALTLPATAASNTVVINTRCALRQEEERCVVIVGGLPVHHYRADDAMAEAYAMVLLVNAGFAQQIEVARAFGKSERTVRRFQKRYAQSGMAGLGRVEGWRPGRRRIGGERLRAIERLKSESLSNRAIAQRLGVNEKAIRKLLGPSKDQGIEQLSFPPPTNVEPLTSASVTALPVPQASVDAPQATVMSETAQDEVATKTAGQVHESVPISLDSDASDRTFDRQLAYLGMLDDAAPMFREGSRVAGAGVLWALPCLIDSGLLNIARRLYGSIGPAFYGLRTTLVTLWLMALLRPVALRPTCRVS